MKTFCVQSFQSDCIAIGSLGVNHCPLFLHLLPNNVFGSALVTSNRSHLHHRHFRHITTTNMHIQPIKRKTKSILQTSNITNGIHRASPSSMRISMVSIIIIIKHTPPIIKTSLIYPYIAFPLCGHHFGNLLPHCHTYNQSHLCFAQSNPLIDSTKMDGFTVEIYNVIYHHLMYMLLHILIHNKHIIGTIFLLYHCRNCVHLCMHHTLNCNA